MCTDAEDRYPSPAYNDSMKKIMFALLGLGMCVAPLAASAETISRTLAVGSSGPQVVTLQKILAAQGYLKTTPTGYFGSVTRQAVIAYQKANGLAQVGSVGPKTRALLNAYVPTMDPVVAAPAPNTAPTGTPVPESAPPSTSTSGAQVSPNDPPKITLISPATVLPRTSQQVTLQVATDKIAYCRYGTLLGQSFTSMTAFAYSGSTSHTTTFSSLATDALYVYYVRCEDMAAHISPDLMVTFSLTQR